MYTETLAYAERGDSRGLADSVQAIGGRPALTRWTFRPQSPSAPSVIEPATLGKVKFVIPACRRQ